MQTSLIRLGSVAAVLALAGVAVQARTITGGGYTATDGNLWQWTELSTDAGATRVLGSDDDATTSSINLGFNFSLFGQTYNQTRITSNGLLTFGGTSTTRRDNRELGEAFPYTTMPFMAVAWDDWTTAWSGTDGVYYKTDGVAGSRSFTVQWNQTKTYDEFPNSNHTPVTFEAVLYEGSNAFEYRYLSMNTGGPSATSTYADASYGATATAGVRDVDAGFNGRFLQWSNNSPELTDQLRVTYNVSAVPEPESVALMLAGLGLVGAVARRRRTARA